jgi:hypothetical protein
MVSTFVYVHLFRSSRSRNQCVVVASATRIVNGRTVVMHPPPISARETSRQDNAVTDMLYACIVKGVPLPEKYRELLEPYSRYLKGFIVPSGLKNPEVKKAKKKGGEEDEDDDDDAPGNEGVHTQNVRCILHYSRNSIEPLPSLSLYHRSTEVVFLGSLHAQPLIVIHMEHTMQKQEFRAFISAIIKMQAHMESFNSQFNDGKGPYSHPGSPVPTPVTYCVDPTSVFIDSHSLKVSIVSRASQLVAEMRGFRAPKDDPRFSE